MSAHSFVMLERPGDVLSPSGASGYLSCGAKWAYRHIQHLPDPPTGALSLGTAVHVAIGANFEQKMETKQDLPAAGVAAIYTEAWDLLTKGEYPGRNGRPPALPTEFRADEEPAELKAQGLALTLKYLDEACPEIQPAAVELRVEGSIGAVHVRGYIDLLDTTGRVIDLKTAAKSLSLDKATSQYEVSNDYRFQVATYSQICPYASGEARVDTLVKTKTPKLVQQVVSVEEAYVQQTMRMYPVVQLAIRAGQFLPNRQSYMCSRHYCSFWRQCQADFGGKVDG